VHKTLGTEKSRALVLALSLGMIAFLLGVVSLPGCRQLQEQANATELVSAEASNTPTSSSSWPRSVVIPSGTMLLVSLDRPLRTDLEMTGDHFQAHIAEAVRVEGMTVLPRGTEIRGRLTSVGMSHSNTDMAQMTLSFYQIVDPSGQITAISTEAIMLIAAGETRTDGVIVVRGGEPVPQFGELASGRNPPQGKPIGLAAGAAAGSMIAVSTNGRQIKLLAAQHFAVSLSDSCRVSVALITASE
jgi:hypothetical protein